jgi:drug/metabolite transporter (DMT)-like permease
MTLSPALPRRVLWANIYCLLSMLVWSAGLPAIQHLLAIIPPIPLSAMRTGLAGLVLVAIWAAVEGTGAVRHAPWGRGLWVGFVVMGLSAAMIAMALQLTDAVSVAIITATMPIAGIALECLLDRRRLTAQLMLGLGLSVVGGIVVLGRAPASPSLGWGALLTLGSVVAFTWGSRASVKSFPDLSPLGQAALTVAGAGVTMTAASVLYSLVDGPAVAWGQIGLPEVGAMVLASIGAIALSQTLWIVSVGQLGIGISSLHTNATPFYVMLIAFALGAAWNWPQAIGAVVVAFGVLIAQGVFLPRRV